MTESKQAPVATNTLHRRVIEGAKAEVFPTPSSSDKALETLKAGDVFEVKGYVGNGQPIRGEANWFVVEGGFVWAGHFEDATTRDLANYTSSVNTPADVTALEEPGQSAQEARQKQAERDRDEFLQGSRDAIEAEKESKKKSSAKPAASSAAAKENKASVAGSKAATEKASSDAKTPAPSAEAKAKDDSTAIAKAEAEAKK